MIINGAAGLFINGVYAGEVRDIDVNSGPPNDARCERVFASMFKNHTIFEATLQEPSRAEFINLIKQAVATKLAEQARRN